MPDALINMDDPPEALYAHKKLLDRARNAMIALLPDLAAKGLSLDELVVVAVAPEIATIAGRQELSVELRDNLLLTVKHPERRAFVEAPVRPGWMRVVVFASGGVLTLTMNVSTPPTPPDDRLSASASG